MRRQMTRTLLLAFRKRGTKTNGIRLRMFCLTHARASGQQYQILSEFVAFSGCGKRQPKYHMWDGYSVPNAGIARF